MWCGRSDVLRGYLRSESIAPLPLRRLAAAYPDTVDAVFRKILRRRDFTWTEHGEALMRRRKEWYYRRDAPSGRVGHRGPPAGAGLRRSPVSRLTRSPARREARIPLQAELAARRSARRAAR